MATVVVLVRGALLYNDQWDEFNTPLKGDMSPLHLLSHARKGALESIIPIDVLEKEMRYLHERVS